MRKCKCIWGLLKLLFKTKIRMLHTHDAVQTPKLLCESSLRCDGGTSESRSHPKAFRTRVLPEHPPTLLYELIKLQHDDSTLSHLFELAKDKSLIFDDLPVFYLEKGIIMRSWRDKQLPTLSGTEFSQIVVPKPLRAKILKLAHGIPAAAHLGMIKTKKLLEQYFYRPSMSEDIKLYVRTCDVCQRLGKGGEPAPDPLHNLPVIAEPFSRIAIDIISPMPVCRDTGSRFILTVVDHCTHFPEAVPLVTYEAVDVAKALLSVSSIQ